MTTPNDLLTDARNVIQAFNEDRNGDWQGLTNYALLSVLIDIAESLRTIAARKDEDS